MLPFAFPRRALIALVCAAALPCAAAPAARAQADTLAGEGGTGRRSSIGGYGDIHGEWSDDEKELALDRFVIFLGHEFSDRVQLYSEVEVEDAHEVEMEQAYVAFGLAPALAAHAGLVLVPISRVNLLHEPPTYLPVKRPLVDRVIVPTTWREIGAGFEWQAGGTLDLSAYVLDGLDAHGFTAAEPIRGGRQSGAEAAAHDLAVAGRAAWSPALGISVAASGYTGKAAQGDTALDGVRVSLLEADAELARSGWFVRAQGAWGFLDEAQKVTTVTGEIVGSRFRGVYAVAGYDVLRALAPSAGGQLTPFVQFDYVDPRAELPDGQPAPSALARTAWTVGLSYRPVPGVAIKGDVVFENPDLGDTETIGELGLGFMF